MTAKGLYIYIHERPMLETLDFTIRICIGSTPTFLYFAFNLDGSQIDLISIIMVGYSYIKLFSILYIYIYIYILILLVSVAICR